MSVEPPPPYPYQAIMGFIEKQNFDNLCYGGDFFYYAASLASRRLHFNLTFNNYFL